MGEQILKYLIDVVFGLFTYALLLRFVMQAMRAPFRNPLGQAVIALTCCLATRASTGRR